MLRVNRLKIVVRTSDRDFGFDSTFDKKINFIASNTNTRGKSSCIESIYYCLGLEELIGGKNEKALKPVFRDKLEYENKEVNVLESEFYLEIKGKKGVIKTIYRTSKKENFDSRLVRVYDGNLEDTINEKCNFEDMYVHFPGGATNKRGYHKFLEDFMGFNLPKVPSYNDEDCKLYLQVLFSAIFIEQKKGWSDLFSLLITYFKIREPKKRVVEYLIGLESLKTEHMKQLCKDKESYIKTSWEQLYDRIYLTIEKSRCLISNIERSPEIIDEDELKEIHIYKLDKDSNKIDIREYIPILKNKIETLNNSSNLIGDNLNNLEASLSTKQDELLNMELKLEEEKRRCLQEEQTIKSLKTNLETIKSDLLNNKDIARIKKLGSTENWNINNNICPTCSQNIKDILLPLEENITVMGLDENIKHLESQKSMLEFAIKTRYYNKKIINENIEYLKSKILDYRHILRSIKNDLYSIDSNFSETIIREKLLLEREIEDLEFLQKQVCELYGNFLILSKELKLLEEEKSKLPQDKFTANDKNKIKRLKENFIENLKLYGYESIVDFSKIEISEDKLLPIINGFDMKFDSSASDNIRAIWAFTVALMQTSLSNNGNHPNILIFDEPAQQSIVVSDMYNFIKSLSNQNNDFQVIIGITLKDDETKECIKKLSNKDYKLVLFENRTIMPVKN